MYSASLAKGGALLNTVLVDTTRNSSRKAGRCIDLISRDKEFRVLYRI